MKLYSAWFCPFAQRIWVSILYKGLDFEYLEIDPYDKTPSWMQISRGAGLVPVLELKNNEGENITVIDSFRIMEFIDEYYQGEGPSIFPESPEGKAETKFWMDFIATQIIPYFYRYLMASEAGKARDEAKESMLKGMEVFTQAMCPQGPFFLGDKFGAVDIAFAPFSNRIEILLAHYRNFKLPAKFLNLSRYNRWYQAVIEQPAFRISSFDQNNYESRLIEFYQPYNLGGGQSDVAEP